MRRARKKKKAGWKNLNRKENNRTKKISRDGNASYEGRRMTAKKKERLSDKDKVKSRRCRILPFAESNLFSAKERNGSARPAPPPHP
jgi:hypothetical protein